MNTFASLSPVKPILLLLVMLGFFLPASKAQNSLPDMITEAQSKSTISALIRNELQLAKAKYTAFKINYRPYLSLSGNAPVYNKDNNAVIQPDGSVKFLSRTQGMSNVNLSFTQPLAISGGSVSLNTDLARYDNFERKTNNYNGTPVFLRIDQPLFGYNRLKWDKKIEPLKLQEAVLMQNEEMRQLAYEICVRFFDVAEAQTDQQLAETNLLNTTINLTMENKRVQAGTSTEDKVLQLEMQRITFLQHTAIAGLSVKESWLNLSNVLNRTDTVLIKLELPGKLPFIRIDKEEAIRMAKNNHSKYLSFERKIREAESNIARAKAQNRNIDMTLSYGLNNAELTIPELYRHPDNQQRFSIGFSVPLADWGKRKNGIDIALLEKNKTAITNKTEETKFIEEITNLVNKLPVMQSTISQALYLDTLSQRRFLIANRLYELGKINLLELQEAQVAKDNARRNYVRVLREFWESWYLLKIMTNN